MKPRTEEPNSLSNKIYMLPRNVQYLFIQWLGLELGGLLQFFYFKFLRTFHTVER